MPVGSVAGVTVSGGGFTMIWKRPLAVRSPESTTVAVKEKVPVWVGVPVIVPLELSVSPGGSEPAETDHT